MVTELQRLECEVFVHDPLADADEAQREYGIRLLSWNELPRADSLALCVMHEALAHHPLEDYDAKVAPGGGIADIKSALDRRALEGVGLHVWRL